MGKNCGSVSNGCGGTLNCGTCTSPQTCGGGGTPNVCGCTPTTCAAQGKNCGSISNGCGGTLNCGTCTSPQTCGGGGTANVCGCTPTTCAAQGKNCGSISNGCGGTLSCGSCTAPQTCGGGGTANVCGCTPSCTGKNCGDNGCGGSCGSCTSPATCVSGTCTLPACSCGGDLWWPTCTAGCYNSGSYCGLGGATCSATAPPTTTTTTTLPASCEGCTWCDSGRLYQAQGPPGDLPCPNVLRCDLGCSVSCPNGCTSSSDCRSNECSGDYVRIWSCSSCQCTKTDTLCQDSCSSTVTGGCYESDFTCKMNLQGSPYCDYTTKNAHEDGGCTYTGCSGSCTRTGSYPDYGCSGGACTYTAKPCSANCGPGTACSGGSCSTGSCGTKACPASYCSGLTAYAYPASCSKYCDGSGTCADCTCTATSTACTASGCCSATCSSGVCGKTKNSQACLKPCTYKACLGSSCATYTDNIAGTKICKDDCTLDTECTATCPASTCTDDASCGAVTTTTTTLLCTAVGLSSPSVSPSSPNTGNTFDMSCPTTSGGSWTDCVYAYANGDSNQCLFSYWNGKTAKFVCYGMAPGTYTAKCKTITGTSSNCCASSATTSYTVVDPCTQYGQVQCGDTPGCTWCDNCDADGRHVSGAQCRSDASYCQYAYVTGKCGIACTQNSDCKCKEACTTDYPNCNAPSFTGTCNQATHTCSYSGVPSTETNCADHVDNDCNGAMDCGDANCAADPVCALLQNPCVLMPSTVICDSFSIYSGKDLADCRPPAFPSPYAGYQAYCCKNPVNIVTPTGSLVTYCCYEGDNTQQTKAECQSSVCEGKKLKALLLNPDGTAKNFCGPSGWLCEYSAGTDVGCCLDTDCGYGANYAKMSCACPSGCGITVPATDSRAYKCQEVSCYAGTNDCDSTHCCTDGPSTPNTGDKTCVPVPTVKSNNKYLCASGSPIGWHECNSQNVGKILGNDGKSYICLSENGIYSWKETFGLKYLMLSLALAFFSPLLLKKFGLIKPGLKKRK